MKFTATTLPELRREYNTARRELIEAHAKIGATQTAAAERLGVKLNALNNIIHREGIFWPVKRQGRNS